MALPGVVLLTAALLVAGQAALGEVRCTDAARAGARLAARGEPGSVVVAEAIRLAPPGAQVAVSRTGDEVRVEVSLPSGTPYRWARLTMRASAVASVEGDDSPSVGVMPEGVGPVTEPGVGVRSCRGPLQPGPGRRRRHGARPGGGSRSGRSRPGLRGPGLGRRCPAPGQCGGRPGLIGSRRPHARSDPRGALSGGRGGSRRRRCCRVVVHGGSGWLGHRRGLGGLAVALGPAGCGPSPGPGRPTALTPNLPIDKHRCAADAVS